MFLVERVETAHSPSPPSGSSLPHEKDRLSEGRPCTWTRFNSTIVHIKSKGFRAASSKVEKNRLHYSEVLQDQSQGAKVVMGDVRISLQKQRGMKDCWEDRLKE